MTITKKLVARSVTTLLFLAVATTSPVTQSAVTLVGLGDSLAEGVQSGDANEFTQHFSFVNLIAAQMGAAMPLPLIRSGLTGLVGSTNGRFRIDTTVRTLNLGVSGATAQSILTNSATATIPAEIDTETELVLFPEIGSQIEIAERLAPTYTACWIGNNDVSGSILSFNQLDATQLTPVASFTSSFTQLVNRLEATGTKAVFSTIPDISDVGYLLNGPDLIRFLGSDHGLPAGSLSTVGAMLLVKLGLESPAIITNPNYVLDPTEQQIISQHIGLLNDVIRTTVASKGMALADMQVLFEALTLTPLDFLGVSLQTRFLGGLFSLDGVHPSDIGQGIVAFFFIHALNTTYGAGIPQLDGQTLYTLANTDPFIDKDGDGRVIGRVGQGLLESIFFLLGITGDTDDGTLGVPLTGTQQAIAPDSSARRKRALDEYARVTGRDLRKMSHDERVKAVRALFGK